MRWKESSASVRDIASGIGGKCLDHTRIITRGRSNLDFQRRVVCLHGLRYFWNVTLQMTASPKKKRCDQHLFDTLVARLIQSLMQ